MAESWGVWQGRRVEEIQFQQFPFIFFFVFVRHLMLFYFSSCKALMAEFYYFLLGFGVLPFLSFRVLVYKLPYDVIFGDLILKLKLREFFSFVL